MGAELASMLARGEPVGRIEVRWESMLRDLDEPNSFVALAAFVREGLEDPLARLSKEFVKHSEKEAETQTQELAKLSESRRQASRSHLIAIETGISELVDSLRRIEKELGDSPSRTELSSQRVALATLGRIARELRRAARRSFEES